MNKIEIQLKKLKLEDGDLIIGRIPLHSPVELKKAIAECITDVVKNLDVDCFGVLIQDDVNIEKASGEQRKEFMTGKWKTTNENTPENDALCICKYDVGVAGWEYRFNHYLKGRWFSQYGKEDKAPNYYKDRW